jgi:hypothetical protein
MDIYTGLATRLSEFEYRLPERQACLVPASGYKSDDHAKAYLRRDMLNGKTVTEQHADINNTNTGSATIKVHRQTLELHSNPRTFEAISEAKTDKTQEKTLSLL